MARRRPAEARHPLPVVDRILAGHVRRGSECGDPTRRRDQLCCEWGERITDRLRETLLRRDDGAFCAYCGLSGTGLLDPDENVWQIDHLIPRSKGGSDHYDNLVLACEFCNRSKRTLSAAQFVALMETW